MNRMPLFPDEWEARREAGRRFRSLGHLARWREFFDLMRFWESLILYSPRRARLMELMEKEEKESHRFLREYLRSHVGG